MFKLIARMGNRVIALAVIFMFFLAIVCIEYGKYIFPVFLVVGAVWLWYRHDNEKHKMLAERNKPRTPLCNCKLCHDIYYYGEYRSDLQDIIEEHRRDIERSNPSDFS
jgi:hypothetical protein